jgi:hypothetical protein
VACNRFSSGTSTPTSSGTPISTTAASTGETSSSRPPTRANATTEPTPGPLIVMTRVICWRSVLPMFTTSPADTRRGSDAPSRTTCRSTSCVVR